MTEWRSLRFRPVVKFCFHLLGSASEERTGSNHGDPQKAERDGPQHCRSKGRTAQVVAGLPAFILEALDQQLSGPSCASSSASGRGRRRGNGAPGSLRSRGDYSADGPGCELPKLGRWCSRGARAGGTRHPAPVSVCSGPPGPWPPAGCSSWQQGS